MGCVNTRRKPTVRTETANKTGLPSQYEEIESLGKGAYGEVKLYRHSSTNLEYAVKVFAKDEIRKGALTVEQIQHEFNAMKALDHPNIVRAHSLHEDENNFYMVTEYCDGGTLRKLLESRNKLPEPEAAAIMFQLLSAIVHCHERKVIHRDIKPENILLTKDLTVKLVDFGGAAFVHDKKPMRELKGTPWYLAPEVLREAYTEKCDCWSAGIVLYEMLSGNSPYPRFEEVKQVEQQIELVRKAPFYPYADLLPDQSPVAIGLLQGLLNRDFRMRFHARVAVNHRWIKTHRSLTGESPLRPLQAYTMPSKFKNMLKDFLVQRKASKDQVAELTRQFQAIDRNGDGKLSKAELLSHYQAQFGEDGSEEAVEAIMERVDADASGNISYTEFVRACLDDKLVFVHENLELAFREFDIDGNNTVSLQELKEMFEGQDDVVSFFEQADQNNDGVIEMQEFLNLFTS